jgi:predicted NAD/FAD-dependent oxidoreductase
MARVAIVGAGVAGLSTAYALRTLPIDVTIFEKSRGYGGRAATRGRYGCRYDHGASYFTAPTERVERLVTAHLPTDGLLEIGKSIWTFSENGTLSRPTSRYEASPKWTYRQGISRLGKLLARFSRADVRTDVRIDRLQYRNSTWVLRDDDGQAHSAFDGVVLTSPAPQTADLLATSDVEGARFARIQGAVNAVSYTSQFSFVFAFDRAVSRPGDFYGLVNADGKHPIAWLAFEHDKPGHVRGNHSMVIVHTAPEWTDARVDQEPDGFVPEIKEMAEDILVTDLRHPAWYDVQRWRYAEPTSALNGEMVTAGTAMGLFLAGDYVSGVGRVGDAIETGYGAAQQVKEAM